MFLNANIVLGFNKWQILSSPGEGATMLILAAGPVVSILLASFGIALLYRSKRPFSRLTGLSLAIFNPLIIIGSVVLGSLAGATYNFGASEHPWKLLLLPAFAVLLLFGLGSLREGLVRTVKRGFILLALAVGVGLLILAIDEIIVWPGIEAGISIFAPIFGISAPVILVNIVTFVGFALICKRGLAKYA